MNKEAPKKTIVFLSPFLGDKPFVERENFLSNYGNVHVFNNLSDFLSTAHTLPKIDVVLSPWRMPPLAEGEHLKVIRDRVAPDAALIVYSGADITNGQVVDADGTALAPTKKASRALLARTPSPSNFDIFADSVGETMAPYCPKSKDGATGAVRRYYIVPKPGVGSAAPYRGPGLGNSRSLTRLTDYFGMAPGGNNGG